MPLSSKLKNDLQQLQAFHLSAAQKATFILNTAETGGVSTPSTIKAVAANNAVIRRSQQIARKVAAMVFVVILLTSCVNYKFTAGNKHKGHYFYKPAADSIIIKK